MNLSENNDIEFWKSRTESAMKHCAALEAYNSELEDALSATHEELNKLRKEKASLLADMKYGGCHGCVNFDGINKWSSCESRHFRIIVDNLVQCRNFEWRGLIDGEEQLNGR